MEKYQFRTNINCSGCLARVTPFLDGNQQIKRWEVETDHPKKILTVEAEGLTDADIKAIVTKAGFNIERI